MILQPSASKGPEAFDHIHIPKPAESGRTAANSVTPGLSGGIHGGHPTPVIDAATRLVRQARAAHLDEIHSMVDSGANSTDGHRSPTSWLCATSCENYGHGTQTIALAKRITDSHATKPCSSAGRRVSRPKT